MSHHNYNDDNDFDDYDQNPNHYQDQESESKSEPFVTTRPKLETSINVAEFIPVVESSSVKNDEKIARNLQDKYDREIEKNEPRKKQEYDQMDLKKTDQTNLDDDFKKFQKKVFRSQNKNEKDYDYFVASLKSWRKQKEQLSNSPPSNFNQQKTDHINIIVKLGPINKNKCRLVEWSFQKNEKWIHSTCSKPISIEDYNDTIRDLWYQID